MKNLQRRCPDHNPSSNISVCMHEAVTNYEFCDAVPSRSRTDDRCVVLCSRKAAVQATFELRICADNSSNSASIGTHIILVVALQTACACCHCWGAMGFIIPCMQLKPFLGGDHSERQKI